MCRCSTRLYLLRGTGRSFFCFWYPHLFYISAIFDSTFTAFSCHLLVIIHLLSLCSFICIIAVTIDYYASDLQLVQVTIQAQRVYVGYFSSRICVTITSPYLQDRGVTVTSCQKGMLVNQICPAIKNGDGKHGICLIVSNVVAMYTCLLYTSPSPRDS